MEEEKEKPVVKSKERGGEERAKGEEVRVGIPILPPFRPCTPSFERLLTNKINVFTLPPPPPSPCYTHTTSLPSSPIV